MKKILVCFTFLLFSFVIYSQDKKVGFILGVNRMSPTDLSSNSEPDIGLEIGFFSQKLTFSTFNLEKGIYLSKTSFADYNLQNELVIENETYSLSVPFVYKMVRLNPFHPYVGLEAFWHFSSKTDYYKDVLDEEEVSPVQLAFALGVEVPIANRYSLDLKYIVTPYLISVGPIDLNGIKFSLKYILQNKNN